MCAYRMCRPPTPAGVVSAAPVRYKTDDRVDSKIVTAAQVAMLGKLNSVCIYGSAHFNTLFSTMQKDCRLALDSCT